MDELPLLVPSRHQYADGVGRLKSGSQSYHSLGLVGLEGGDGETETQFVDECSLKLEMLHIQIDEDGIRYNKQFGT